MIKRIIIIAAFCLVIILISVTKPASYFVPQDEPEEVIIQTPSPAPPPAPPPPLPFPAPREAPVPTPAPDLEPVAVITVTAAGDVTLGGVYGGNSYSSFMREFADNDEDFGYFLRNFKEIFDADDLTIVNFEGTLTELTQGNGIGFNFRAPPEFVQVLSSSGVDAVTLANNHINDFGAAGVKDTKNTLAAAGIAYFGDNENTVIEVNGIKVGMFGFLTWNNFDQQEKKITAAVKALKDKGAQFIIAYFHWGHELETEPDKDQMRMGRFAVDAGADLVLGSHPHVIQGIEVYKGVNIVYSLANFCFAGNRYPLAGFDTFVYQQTFIFINNELFHSDEPVIIPARITSAPGHNNYQPTPAEGATAQRITDLIEEYSRALNPGINGEN